MNNLFFSKISTLSWVIIVTIIVIFVVLCFFIELDIINIVAVLGTALTLMGLIVTLDQVFTVRKISDETKDKVLSFMSITDIDRVQNTIRDVEKFVGERNWSAAENKLNDLRLFLLEFKESSEFDIINADEFSSIINEIMDIKINMFFIKQDDAQDTSNLRISNILTILERVKEILIQYKIKLSDKII